MRSTSDEEGWTPVRAGSTGSVGWRGVPLAGLTYAVIDLETTGLKPQGNGITEVCCLRVAGGEVVDRFSTLVNPGRPIPPFVQNMTGITDSMVRDAPSFRDVIPSLLDFLGDSVLVAHHAPFDLSFLNYALFCDGRSSLHNPVVDTRRLARRLLPDLPRADLGSVAQRLGVSIQGRHRAYGDAEATARVLLELLSMCRTRGIESDAQLLAFVGAGSAEGGPRPTVQEDGRAARLSVLVERCRTLPDSPGVYLMRSAAGRVLYVGKAASLRKRLASYFNGGVPARTQRLLGEVETIEHVQLGSELEALLEESRLIKRHQPPYNILLRSYRNFPFIKVDRTGPYPQLVVTREIADDGSRYIGPFRSVQGTELAVGILSRCFRLFDGRCPGRTSGESCVYLQMGRCLAPCLDPERRASYEEAVEDVCRILETEPDDLVAELVRRREVAAERLDFETAALYRDGIDALRRSIVRRKLLSPAVEGLNVLAVCPSMHPGWADLFVFGEGRLVARARIFAGDGLPERSSVESFLEMVGGRWAGTGRRASLRIDAESLDQVNIISTWLDGQGARASTITLEPGWTSARFSEVVTLVTQAATVAASRE